MKNTGKGFILVKKNLTTNSKTLFFSIVCSEIPFNKNSYHIETGQLICIYIDWFLYDAIFYWKLFPNRLKYVFQWLLLSVQSWTKGWRQIHKIKQNRFFYGMFYSWFFAIFYRKTSKPGFWAGGWVHHHTQAFQRFSWNFLISWDLKSFSRSATREATRTFISWW